MIWSLLVSLSSSYITLLLLDHQTQAILALFSFLKIMKLLLASGPLHLLYAFVIRKKKLKKWDTKIQNQEKFENIDYIIILNTIRLKNEIKYNSQMTNGKNILEYDRWRVNSLVVKNPNSRFWPLGLNPRSIIYWLCDLEHHSISLCLIFLTSKTRMITTPTS